MAQLCHYDWASVPLDLTWCDLFWACPIRFHLVWPFLGFRLKCLPKKLIPINSWLMQYLGKLNRFNSWLRWFSRESTQNELTTQVDPQVLIQIDSWLKWLSRELTQNQLMAQADPQLLIQIDWWLKRKTFDSESTHDLTLSRAHFCSCGSNIRSINSANTSLWFKLSCKHTVECFFAAMTDSIWDNSL